MTTPLQKAAQAVIDRWDSQLWKDQPHTAEYIAELRKALDVEIAQAVEPVGHFINAGEFIGWREVFDDHEFASDVVPLYLHPPQPQATTPVPDMFWNRNDSEQCHDSIGCFLNDEICNGFLEVGTVFTIMQAKRLPDVQIKVTNIDDEECEAEYEVITAAQGEKP